MNPAHLHLMITHVPVLGVWFGVALLLVAIVQGNQPLRRTSQWVFVLAALAVVPTYLSGRPANALLVKSMPGMSMDASDQHAEIAVLALSAAALLGIVALVGLLVFRHGKRAPGWFTTAIVLLAVTTAALLAWTATLGGGIRHPEIVNTSDSRQSH